MNLRESVIEKVLSGCPNLECLELDSVWGIHRLEISSVKLRKLIIKKYEDESNDIWFEILVPYVHNLQLLGSCNSISLRNVASLVTAVLYVDFDLGDGDEFRKKECSCLKELLHSVAHVENLDLGPWCIEGLSILELKGWQPSPSSRKFLKLNAAIVQLDFPGLCSFLQSSSDLETLVIDWHNPEPRAFGFLMNFEGRELHLLFSFAHRGLLSRYTNEDEQSRRFKTHNFNGSLLHLKTIKVFNFDGSLSGNKSVLQLVKYLLKNATVLEKFVIAAKFEGSDESQDYVKMAQDFQSFPRSSLHASVVFSY
ncbi:uncharacterized protein LOC132609230 [Lycium barbarum]|uniref:uncharacterized protein LOC132609230 n=1 Tax=Lycium barbarum TaxID=112863 RepID=UPI00293F317C|nr:uncharacterized protein LOC132609230 [Lycium barbarum]XP_060179090.1 uncharacterized protein LOC132609230 [Lycium barbarum]